MIEQEKEKFINTIEFPNVIEKEEDRIIIVGNGKTTTINIKNARYIVETFHLMEKDVYRTDKNELCIDIIRVGYDDGNVAIKVCGNNGKYELKVTDDGFTIHSVSLDFKQKREHGDVGYV